ncbi:ribosome maturation factor RimM [Roseivirga misakiensis]|uniref:Ribosome maturation factor RimM n=1 Tax=Roseivirga misakiensis TaxID=1563681 RepID=A0A1E5T3L6_9BACT|nr:ribosome maturation factor RimM [Roseivirga misakiensis]OEK05931.1 16S rRNA processing protein RimM [Roseivirga misakiensis]
MTVDDCYQLGYVVKTHGLRGEVQIFLDVDSPNQYKNLESVFVLNGQRLVPFFIESISFNGAKAIVAFEDVYELADAQALKGKELYLPLTALPSLKGKEFYLHEVIGFSMIDNESQKVVGTIDNVIESGPQLLFSVLAEGNIELLIPFHKDLLKELDRENKTMSLAIPEGLLDVYLNDNED